MPRESNPAQTFEPVSVDDGWPCALANEALYGLAGEIVDTISPHSEADPAGILGQFLVAFGNAAGSGPHFVAEADRHGVNLFATFVGSTAKGRKGVSWGQARRAVVIADEGWERCISSGLSSGEGLIWQVRDPIEKLEAVKEKGQVVGHEPVVIDEGVTDKRLMVFEGEFAVVLRVLAREGNTLSAIIRNAWDTGHLQSMTKNSPARATGAHISIAAHITKDELLRHLRDTEAGNGFANRFLWFCVRRSKVLPEGGQLHWEDLVPLIDCVREALRFANNTSEIHRDEAARKIWHAVYPTLSEGRPGLIGAVLARAEAQVMRLACVYALLDQSTVIRAEHLNAALAVWEYCEASAEHIFGESLGDPDADEILQTIRQSANGLTRTEIRDLFGRHRRTDAISRAIGVLARQGLVRCESETTGGRPVERYRVVRTAP